MGKSTLVMPEIIDLPLDKAKVMLFEAGFSSENIFFRERYSDKTPGTVTASTVKPRETVSADEKIIIDYCPESQEADVSSEG
ncbi:MAG: PASTA domain-containing protein [Clostridia bacterium]|nr:PASTA domain-containing protein [Clostridia bacterium]